MKLHNGNLLYSPMVGNFASWFIAFGIMSFYVNGYTDNPIVMVIGMFVGSQWTLWLHAYRQSERMEIKGLRIDHTKATILRAIVALFIGLATHFLADGFTLHAILNSIACALFLGSIFWLEFDFFMNIHRELPLTYLTSDPHGARTDVFFYDKKGLWVASKVIGLIIGIGLYYWILELPL